MDDFYITLPSTVPNPQHKNTSSRYVTRLPEVLNLERDKYVVAASDVIYPYSYVNVGKQLDYWIHFKSRLPIHISIPPAQYSDAAQIVNTLNGSQVRLKRSAALALVDSEIARVKRARTDEVGNLDADITSLDEGGSHQIAGVFEPIADEYSMLEGPGHAATEEETIGDEFGALAAADENVETIGKEFGALAADENVETMGKEFDALAAADKKAAEMPAKSDGAKSEKSGVAKSEKSEKSDVAKSEKSEKSKKLLFEQQVFDDDAMPPSASSYQVPPPVEVPERETRFDKRKLQEERVLEQAMDEEYQALDSPPPTSSHQVPPPVEVPEKETRFDRKKLQEERVLEQVMDEEYRALDPPPPTSSYQVPPPAPTEERETRFDGKKLREERVLEQARDEEYQALDSPPPTSSHRVPPPVEVPERETRFDGKNLREERVLDSSGQAIADEYAAIDDDDDELGQIDSEFAKLARARIEHEAAARAYTAAQAAVVNVVGDETIYSLAVEMLKKQRARITTESRPSSRDFLKFTIVADTLYCDFLDADILFVELDEPCAYFLGFVDPIVRKSQKAEKKIDYFGNVSTLYLYCDVVDPIIVGNTKSSLLSIIPCKGKYGEMIHSTIPHPRYLPLMKSTIDSIRVEFLTEFGEPIDFNWGSTIIVLHFKKIE